MRRVRLRMLFVHVVCTCRYSGGPHGFVAQWIERLSPEQKVVGSNPIKPTEQAVAPVLRGGFTHFWVLGYRPECVSGGGQAGMPWHLGHRGLSIPPIWHIRADRMPWAATCPG